MTRDSHFLAIVALVKLNFTDCLTIPQLFQVEALKGLHDEAGMYFTGKSKSTIFLDTVLCSKY